jgi:hypothetical protein
MEVETLDVARSLGWKVHMRCAHGYRESTRSIRKCVCRKQLDLDTLVATRVPNFPMRKCVYRKQLDLETLVATRGPNFPLGRLESRLMDPGPHQCDDFCPSYVANDELFDL